METLANSNNEVTTWVYDALGWVTATVDARCNGQPESKPL
ncbi:MAG: hypothetical protein GTN69_05795 [Armatimonadetes bacterium]|nr:hypothetical protein [candidate division Zixibacteria bacterium]NIO75389.1 hypothetical protein [Armatimonadota bacterium]